MNRFFDCEDTLLVKDVVIQDNSIFSLIKNPESGFQVYKMNLERHYTATNKNIDKQNTYIDIFPNPAKDQLYLSKEINKYSIFSMEGRLMLQSDTKTNKVNLWSLPQGVYIIELMHSGISEKHKFIKL